MARNEDDEHEMTKVYTIMSFAAIILGLGIPVWWKTTETYRVALPFDRINRLSFEEWHFQIGMNVILPANRKNDVAALQTKLDALAATETAAVTQELLNIDYKVRAIDRVEEKLIQRSSSLREICEQWSSKVTRLHTFHYDVIILPATASLPQDYESYVCHRRLFILKESTDVSVLASEIRHVAEGFLYRRTLHHEHVPSVIRSPLQKQNKHHLWTVQAAPVYDVTFSLVVPEPGVLRTRWNIQEGIRDLQSMMNKLSSVSRFDLQSQVLYFLPLGVNPRFDEKENAYYLTHEQLPHMINPLEEKLGSHITINPSLHFIVYLPKKAESPLHISNAAGQRSETNSFFSPRWGGIFIHNSDNVTRESGVDWIDVDMQTSVSIIASELRVFLGLSEEFCTRTLCQELDESFLRDWEVDIIMRRHITEYLLTTANTLNSLSALLEEIGNIVINDEVGNVVLEAVDAFERSLASLQQNMPEDALKFAKDAYVASEKAFFDPSMLALLYFPEDQKYAVYVPLFLPVSVPVVLSLLNVVKMRRAKMKSKQH